MSDAKQPGLPETLPDLPSDLAELALALDIATHAAAAMQAAGAAMQRQAASLTAALVALQQGVDTRAQARQPAAPESDLLDDVAARIRQRRTAEPVVLGGCA